MSSGQSINFFWLLGALVLAVSALAARRLSFGSVVRALIAWVLIALAVWAVMTRRPQIESMVNGIADRLGIGEQKVEGKTVRITMSDDGHFWARVTINGVTQRMLVDSGATTTALSEESARAAGVEVSDGGFPVVISTANGSVAAKTGTAARVSIGSITTHDLGVVVSPAFGDMSVLGMNFLSRLGAWRVEGRTLVLEPSPAKS